MENNSRQTGQNSSEPVFCVKGVKAFNSDLTCRGFQFKEGETFHHDGPVKACESGFHFCENPLDTFLYYEPSESVFCEVEGGGEISHHSDDSKVACSTIKIGANLSIPALVKATFSFMMNREYKKRDESCLNEDRSMASNSGTALLFLLLVSGLLLYVPGYTARQWPENTVWLLYNGGIKTKTV